jgi:hypothetical protein
MFDYFKRSPKPLGDYFVPQITANVPPMQMTGYDVTDGMLKWTQCYSRHEYVPELVQIVWVQRNTIQCNCVVGSETGTFAVRQFARIFVRYVFFGKNCIHFWRYMKGTDFHPCLFAQARHVTRASQQRAMSAEVIYRLKIVLRSLSFLDW